MKNLFRILLVGVVAGMGGLFASCTDPGSEIDEIPYNRVLTPLNFTAAVIQSAGNEIEFRWTLMQNADSYVLQVYKDPDNIDGSIVGEDYEVRVTGDAPLPFVVGDLDVDTEYYARIMGVSDNAALESSNWAYLADPATTFAVAPNMNPVVTDRTITSISLAWNDIEPENLNSIRVEAVTATAEPVSVELTDTDKAARVKTIEGLNPVTEYKFTMIFGLTGQRGSVTCWTRPDTSGTTSINSAEALIAAINGATGELKILLAFNDGLPYNVSSVASVGQSLYIYGESSVDGKKPVLSGFGPTSNAGCTTLHFEDLVLDGAGKGSLIENNATPATLDAVEVINCEMFGYAHRLYYGSSAGASCTTLLIDGLYAHDINPLGTSGGDFIDVRNGTMNNIKIRNSTFSFLARTFMRLDAPSTVNTIEVTNCTFNAVTATSTSSNNRGIFAVLSKAGGADFSVTSFTVGNCLFLNEVYPGDNWVRIVRDNADTFAPTFSKNFFYNLGEVFLTSRATGYEDPSASAAGGTLLAADPCVNSIGGKLYLTDPSIAAQKVGDPRWWNASEPVIIRETELAVVTENTVWDFTEKTVWGSEIIPNPNGSIIENLEFYATADVPTEIVMGGGVNFAAKGNVGSDNVPTTGAVGFLVAKYGTVRVTASGDPGTAYSVLVGSDIYPLVADGAPHAVPLGDIGAETMIYVVAGAAMNLTKIEWLSEQLLYDETVTPLGKPVVSLDPSRVEQGASQAVTASWDAVENADSYDVTFRGTTVNQTTTSFEIDAATVAILGAGDYPVSVVAKPMATSTKFSAGEAGTASLTIQPAGAPVTLTWDFSAEPWASEIAAIGSNQPTDLDIEHDGLRVISGGATMRAGTGYFQTGGAGSDTRRNFSFTAPASGTLKVTASNTGSSAGMDRMVTVNVNGVEQSVPGGFSSNTPGICEFQITVSDPTKVLIYPTVNGLRFYKIEFTYIQSAGGTSTWDFAAEPWASEIAAIGSNQPTDLDIEHDGLRIISGGASMRAGTGYFQTGGAGSDTRRNFSFEASASGTLKVTASNTGSSAGMDRMVTVNVNGVEQSVPGGFSSDSPGLCEFQVTVSAPTRVLIYPTVNGLRFYKIEYTW